MKVFEIWSEGYRGHVAQGEWSNAYKMGEQEADTFPEACAKFFSGDMRYTAHVNRYWAMRLFDNEKAARRLYGYEEP